MKVCLVVVDVRRIIHLYDNMCRGQYWVWNFNGRYANVWVYPWVDDVPCGSYRKVIAPTYYQARVLYHNLQAHHITRISPLIFGMLFQPELRARFLFFSGLSSELFLQMKMAENYSGARIFFYRQFPFLQLSANQPVRPKLKSKALLSVP